MQKRALITGITGQDGSYLAEWLLAQDYEVIGMVRRSSTVNFERIAHIQDKLTLVSADVLDEVSIIEVLRARPLSVIRVLRGQEPFMQKNVPKYTPSWVRTVQVWAEASKREISYALCDDRRTLLWFANQRPWNITPHWA